MDDVSEKLRKKTATVRVGGKDKFPIFDKKSAESAVKLEGNAKPPLTKAQRAAVTAKARKFGAK